MVRGIIGCLGPAGAYVKWDPNMATGMGWGDVEK